MIVSMTEEDRQREILSILDHSWKLWQSLASLIDQSLKNRKEVRENPDNWDRICSSSDVINDTTRTIESYVKSDYPNKGRATVPFHLRTPASVISAAGRGGGSV